MQKKRKPKPWNDDDRRVVLKKAGEIPIQDLAKELGRSIQSIQKQANRQGVSTAHPDNIKG